MEQHDGRPDTSDTTEEGRGRVHGRLRGRRPIDGDQDTAQRDLSDLR
jgi:hypothetical protein